MASEVLFFGTVSTSVIGYEVREARLLQAAQDQHASFSLTASASSPFPKTREMFSTPEGQSPTAAAGTPPQPFATTPPTAFASLRPGTHGAGRLRFQRSAFIPVLLEAPTVASEEWDSQKANSSSSGREEDGDDVGYLSLAVQLTLQLHIGGDESGSSEVVPVPVAVKKVRLRSLTHHADHDLCSVVRVVVTQPMLSEALHLNNRSEGEESGDPSAERDGRAAMCFSVMLRVISLGGPVGSILDVDKTISRLLNSESTQPAARYSFRLFSRKAVVPYGSVPLSVLHRLYSLFCSTVYFNLRSQPQHQWKGPPAAVTALWTSTPALQVSEQAFPYRWNTLTSCSLGGLLMGERSAIPLLLTLAHCSNLTQLDLPSNNLSDATCTRLCELFSSHRYLHTLNMADNQVYEFGGDALLRLCRRNHRLTRVMVQGNMCSVQMQNSIQRVVLQSEASMRCDPLNVFSSQYSYLVSPTSLPRPVVREALGVWAQLTAVPLGDINVWPHNSTTEDIDHYVDDSVLPRLKEAQQLAETRPSIIPLLARSPLLSELMRTVSEAMRKVVKDPLVLALFTDVASMGGGGPSAVVEKTPPSRSAPPSPSGATPPPHSGPAHEGGGRAAPSPSSVDDDEGAAGAGTVTIPPPAVVPAEVYMALQLKEESKQAGPLMDVDELYNMSFLRIIVTTFRTLQHQYDWNEVVDVLGKVGQHQAALGVRAEDYWLAVHVWMKALELTAALPDTPSRPDALSSVLLVLSLGLRAAAPQLVCFGT